MTRKTFYILLFVIMIIGLVFRFWNYGGRFGFAYDQAHDVLVAREAIREGKLPLVGPFSSAGPFQTSGTWYWLIMIGVLLSPSHVITPWVWMTAFCSLLIIGMALFGRYLEDEAFGLMAAGLTAVSTAQIAQSVNLTNQTPIPMFSFLAIACAVAYMRKKSVLSAIGLGFFSSMAASIHLQGMALIFLVLWTFVLSGRPKIVPMIAAVFSAVFPMLPLLMWDTSNQFVNIKNMFYYYTKDQFRIPLDVLGRRWLTYVTDFWPREWSHIIGGLPQVAIGLVALGIFVTLILMVRKKLKREWVLILLSFASMVVLLRYTHVPLFASFITFAHPFVLLITTWIIYQIYRLQKFAGMAILVLVLAGSCWQSSIEAFIPRASWMSIWAIQLRNELIRLYPGKQFSFYDLKYDERQRSVPVVLYFDQMNLIGDKGVRIGFIRSKAQLILNTTIVSNITGLVSDLSSSGSAQLVKDGWISVNPSSIYKSTEDWRSLR